MYCSLDRIDIVARHKDTARLGYVLTDHREAAEIQAEPELSVLFALTHVSSASRMGEREGGVEVTYVCMHAPPPFLREAVVSAGGSVSVDGIAVSHEGPVRPLSEIADEAFSGLARRLRGQRDPHADEALLSRIEDETLKAPPKKDDDECAYWTRVLELAAVCGELLRAKVGGRWSVPQDRDGLFPFAFTAGQGTFNVADKAHRFLDQGESQRPSQLLRMVDDLGRGDSDPLMVNLKPADFPRESGVWREILPGVDDVREGLPLVFVGRDQPNTFAYLPAGTEDADRQFEEALANLSRLELTPVEHVIADVKVIVVSDHFYASEKILDAAFLTRLHRRLGAPMLAAAVPHKGLLLVTAEVAPPGIVAFAALAKILHGDSKGAPPLSPVVFLVHEGKIVGHLGSEERKAAGAVAPIARSTKPGSQHVRGERPPKPGFLSRFFKGH